MTQGQSGGTSGRRWGILASPKRATFSTLSSLVSWSIMTWSLLGLGWSPWRPQSTSCGPGGSHGHRLPGLGEQSEVSGWVDGMVVPTFPTLQDLG